MRWRCGKPGRGYIVVMAVVAKVNRRYHTITLYQSRVFTFSSYWGRILNVTKLLGHSRFRKMPKGENFNGFIDACSDDRMNKWRHERNDVPVVIRFRPGDLS